MGINIEGKLLPAWVKCLEVFGAHPRIFGRIDRTTALAYNCIQFIKQAQSLLTTVSKVQSQRHARSGEREHTGRLDVAKGFQYRQK